MKKISIKEMSFDNKNDIITLTNLSASAFINEKNKSRRSYENYDIEDWDIKPFTVLYLVFKEKRFDPSRGIFHLIFSDENPVGFCGGYKHNDEIFIGLVRAYIDPSERNFGVFSEYLIPAQIEAAKNFGCSKFWITFNEYNKPLFNAYKRKQKKLASILPDNSNINNIINKMVFYENRILVKNTWQYVAEVDLNELL